jgi:hypothetical protein
MPSTKRNDSNGGSVDRTDSIKPNNPLQADFDAEDSSSMDSDERYLVWLIGS